MEHMIIYLWSAAEYPPLPVVPFVTAPHQHINRFCRVRHCCIHLRSQTYAVRVQISVERTIAVIILPQYFVQGIFLTKKSHDQGARSRRMIF